MDKQATIRRVRIAVSVFFGVLTVAMCVLWVRSYRTCDIVFHKSTKHVVTTFGSNSATIYLIRAPLPVRPQRPGLPARIINSGWKFDSSEATDVKSFFEWKVTASDTLIRLPIAVLAFAAVVVIVAVWWRQISVRFSLRTMLIATTLVAVVLGLVCYTVR